MIKFNSKVLAWDRNDNCLGNIKLEDIKEGMYVLLNPGEKRQVTGPWYNDGCDLMLPVDDGYSYSQLSLMKYSSSLSRAIEHMISCIVMPDWLFDIITEGNKDTWYYKYVTKYATITSKMDLW